MADTAGSAGEVSVRLSLDTNGLKDQIREAEQKIGRGEGIELQVKLGKGAADSISGQLNGLKGVKPILVTAGLDRNDSVKQINEDISAILGRKTRKVEKIVVPFELSISAEDKALLKAVAASSPALAKATGGKKVQAKATGGHYQPGVPRLVGENGPELEIPGAPGGTIIPTHNMPRPQSNVYRRASGGDIPTFPSYNLFPRGGPVGARYRTNERTGQSQYRDPRSGIWYDVPETPARRIVRSFSGTEEDIAAERAGRGGIDLPLSDEDRAAGVKRRRRVPPSVTQPGRGKSRRARSRLIGRDLTPQESGEEGELAQREALARYETYRPMERPIGYSHTGVAPRLGAVRDVTGQLSPTGWRDAAIGAEFEEEHGRAPMPVVPFSGGAVTREAQRVKGDWREEARRLGLDVNTPDEFIAAIQVPGANIGGDLESRARRHPPAAAPTPRGRPRTSVSFPDPDTPERKGALRMASVFARQEARRRREGVSPREWGELYGAPEEGGAHSFSGPIRFIEAEDDRLGEAIVGPHSRLPYDSGPISAYRSRRRLVTREDIENDPEFQRLASRDTNLRLRGFRSTGALNYAEDPEHDMSELDRQNVRLWRVQKNLANTREVRRIRGQIAEEMEASRKADPLYDAFVGIFGSVEEMNEYMDNPGKRVPVDIRQKMNSFVPGLGHLFGMQHKIMGSIGQGLSPERSLEALARLDEISLGLRAKWTEAFGGQESGGPPKWEDMAPEMQEYLRTRYEAAGAMALGQEIGSVSLTEAEAQLIYGRKLEKKVTGLESKTPKKIKDIKREGSWDRRDAMGSMRLDQDIMAALRDGDEKTYRRVRLFGFQDELENAARNEDGTLDIGQPDLGATIMRSTMQGLNLERRTAAANIRLGQLEQLLEIKAKQREKADDLDAKEKITADMKLLRQERDAVKKIANAYAPGERSRAMGGPLSQRLARNKIQQAYDAGDYAEGQRLQKELEQAKGGWGSAEPKMEPEWVRRQKAGAGVAKEWFGRAMGGGWRPSPPIFYGMELPGPWSEYRKRPPMGKDWQKPYPVRLEGAEDLRARSGNDAVRPWLPEMRRAGGGKLKGGYRYLYRGDTSDGGKHGFLRGDSFREPGGDLPEWMRDNPETKAMLDATGRWYTDTPEKAAYYADHFGTPGNPILRTWVGPKQYERFRLRNQPRSVQRFSGDYDNEWFVDRHVADRAKEIGRARGGANRFGGGLAAKFKGAVKTANYTGGARPSTLSDIEDVAQRATAVTNVGEHGPEKIVHLPEGDFVVPAHQTAQFDRAYGGTGTMNHGVMADWPKGQPMPPWVRMAAANQLRAKEMGRHMGGTKGHGHPHPPDKYQDAGGRWHQVGTNWFTSAPSGYDPARGTNEGTGGMFGGPRYGRRGSVGSFETRGTSGLDSLSNDYMGTGESFRQPLLPGMAPLIPAFSQSRNLNPSTGGAAYGAYGPDPVMMMGAVGAGAPIQLGLGGINSRGGAFGAGYGYGPFQSAGALPAQAQSLAQQGREAGEAMREGFDASGTGQAAGQAMNEALNRPRGALQGQGETITPTGAARARARLSAAGGMPSREQEALLSEIGLGQGQDLDAYAYSDQISGIRSRVSEQLSLTPVRALSVSVGQIFQQALGGRAEIQARAAAANARAARAQRSAGYLENIREQRAAAQFELESGDAIGLFEDQEGEEEGAGKKRREELQGKISKFEAQEAYAEPTVRRQVAEAEEASRGVATRGQKLVAQTLGVAGIVGGTVLFSTAMQAAQAVIGKFTEAAGPAVDALTGFAITTNQVSDELAKNIRGGAGAAAGVAAQQAQLGIGIQTPNIVQEAGRLAGSRNAVELQRQIRAEENLGTRSDLRGVTEDFRNGLFAGIPGLDAVSWIGQDKSLSEVIRGALGPEPEDTAGAVAETRQALEVSDQDALARAIYNVQLDGRKGFPTEQEIDFARSQLQEERSPVVDTQVEAIANALTPINEAYDKRRDQVFEALNDGLHRVTTGLGTFETGLEATDERIHETYKALEPFDKELADKMRAAGVALTGVDIETKSDLEGNFESSTVTDALAAALQGLGQASARQLLAAQDPQLRAQGRQMQRQTRFQTETVIPSQFALNLTRNPLQSSGAQGLFSRNQTDILGFGSQGTGSLDDWAEAIQGVLDQAEALKQVGLDEIFETLQVPKSAVDAVATIADNIRDLGEVSEDLQLGMEQERYNEQLRITRRNVGDLIGLNAKSAASYRKLADIQTDVTDEGVSTTRMYEQQVIQATRLGQLNRAQIDDQREVARLSRMQAMDQRELARISLARNQRELNLQLALARLKAPGETPQERAVRRREAELRAREQQRELDINKRTTERGFGIEDIQYGIQLRGFTIQDEELKRQLQDALRDLSLSESEREIALELRGIEKFRKASETVLQQSATVLESLIGLGTEFEQQAMTVQAQIEAQSGEFLDTFEEEVRKAFKPIKQEVRATMRLIAGEEPATTGRRNTTGRPAQGQVGPTAAGGIFDVNTATRFLAGEAGSESVVVLRGVKSGMLSGGPAGGGGGGGKSVTINIIGAVVRDDRDIDAIAAKVKKAIHDEAEVVGVG